MPDITKCQGITCPIKENCYRYTSEADMYQSYFGSVPYDYENNKCEHFWQDKSVQRENIINIMKADEKDGIYKEDEIENNQKEEGG